MTTGADAPEWKLTITRRFAVPIDLVWRAWTDPQHLARWYCPAEFTVLFVEAEVRVGGVWRSAMRSPEGEEFIHHGVYREIQAPRRLVFTHAWERNHLEPPADTLATVTLAPEGDGTAMTFEQIGFATEASRDSHRGGWSGAFDNLARHVVAPEEHTWNDHG